MHCVNVGKRIENAQNKIMTTTSKIMTTTGDLIFTQQKCISLEIVVHILFQVKGVFVKRFGTYAIYSLAKEGYVKHLILPVSCKISNESDWLIATE